jgi:uncharacterized membrane protein
VLHWIEIRFNGVGDSLREAAMAGISKLTAAMLQALTGLMMLATSAQADLRLCNRMSYVVEAALGVEERSMAATRGWFRLDPGQCRAVLQGNLPSGQLHIHARVPPLYGPSPLPLSGQAEFCVGEDNFTIAGARNCRAGHRPAPFAAVQPVDTEQGPTVTLAEEAGYDDIQARDAGIQRLLVVAGYDAAPIDGIRGAKTDAALTQFLQENKLGNTAAGRSDFFDVLLEAAQKPGNGFAWCNDTAYPVMASLGVEDRNAIVTRGWYRVEPGKCLRPEVSGNPRRLFSFGEAVDANGNTIRMGERPLAWGGGTQLCTRPIKFELYDHGDCLGRGLTASGFAAIDFTGRTPTTIRFK